MTRHAFSFKSIVTSLVLAVGISGPAAAETVDEMFEALQDADPAEAQRIGERIYTEWSKSGSPTIDLLLQRAEDALEAENPQAAVEHLTAAIDHAPDFQQAYAYRAFAYYLMGYFGPALDDLARALEMEPRDYEAMFLFAVMLEEMGDPEGALEVLHKVLALNPHANFAPGVAARLEQALEGTTL